MKKIYVIGIVLAATIGLIALKPQSQTLTPPLPHPTATVTTSPDGIHVNFTPSPNSIPGAPTPERGASILAPEPNITMAVEGTLYPVYVEAGSTVLDAMREVASSSSFTFTGREHPGLGFFVESLNGKKSVDGYYWFLYVNGASSDTGASQTVLHPGDIVEWRYQHSY